MRTNDALAWRRLERQLATPACFERLLEEEEEMEAEALGAKSLGAESLDAQDGEAESGKQVCHDVELAGTSVDKGAFTGTLTVIEPDAWYYTSYITGIQMSGRYVNGHSQGLSPTGTAFLDQQKSQAIFFLNNFLPFNENKYPPGGVLSSGTGRFVNPPAALRLATPNIQWKVAKLGRC